VAGQYHVENELSFHVYVRKALVQWNRFMGKLDEGCEDITLGLTLEGENSES
jgi:hypothetical protein